MNRIAYPAILMVLLAASAAKGQYIRYTVQLRDKAGSVFSVAQPSAFLSTKSIERRSRQNIPIDSTDLPVSQVYIDSLLRISGVQVINTSKWLNNVLVQVPDDTALNRIKAFPFVVHTTPVALKGDRSHPPVIRRLSIFHPPVTIRKPAQGYRNFSSNLMLDDTVDYGANYAQVHIHEGEFLHNQGFRGQGMTIAIIDAGFRNYLTNPALDSVRTNHQVLGEYDFVHNETSVNEDDAHGANCFTILAANMPGKMVGTAPKAGYYLYKTEETASEKPVEEQFWIAAAEKADSVGADMISTSLGYTNFDDTSLNLNYTQRDGKTAPITIAANMAVKKGMIVACSSGNSGQLTDDFRFVACPADGDDVTTVGAVNTSGVIAPFSSGGPNGAGKLKPNVVSVGWNTVYTNTNGVVTTGNGTSYSNPNMAGLIACLWQAFSDFKNTEITDAIERSADRFNNPDELYGYGIPNMRKAYQILALKRQERLDHALQRSWITAYPVPFHQSFTLYFKAPASGNVDIRVVDASGKLMQLRSEQVIKDGYYNLGMNLQLPAAGTYYLQYNDGKNNAILRLSRL